MSVLARLKAVVDRWTHRLVLTAHDQRSCEGFTIYGEGERDFALVIEAIELLRDSDPLRFRRAVRHLPLILCSPLGTYGSRVHRTLYLNTREFSGPVSVALVLVYASMQAVVIERYPRKAQEALIGQRICVHDGEHFLRRAGRFHWLEPSEIEDCIAELRHAHGDGPFNKTAGAKERSRQLRELLEYARGRW
ncbi:hypothetical protein [Myxococcus qinghaiensis]|uniref:hypothetical protein n=1 Tax=Myxococcus qinghaiensis TaxID=2906758 RepID=UPI0020A7F8AA|nr:hypothetical protein [Myxococcus qinghaiensis]MCP3169922.1 hypothetical protein [Myxococcus qinghaiensis]